MALTVLFVQGEILLKRCHVSVRSTDGLKVTWRMHPTGTCVPGFTVHINFQQQPIKEYLPPYVDTEIALD